MSGTKLSDVMHTARAATDKIPAEKGATKGYHAPRNFYPPGHLFGLTLANNVSDATNDIDIAAGSCADSTYVSGIDAAAMTKRLDAGWAAGTNQGFRNSARAIQNATYHVFAVWKADGTQDYYALDNADGATEAAALAALQAETGGSGYVYARRIGSIIRASAAIVAFSQDGDEFLLGAPVADFPIAASLGTSAILQTLASVPAGIKVTALVALTIVDVSPSSNYTLLATSPDQADTAPSSSLFTLRLGTTNSTSVFGSASAPARIRTNTSRQIRVRLDQSGADFYAGGATHGWVDTRGRLA